MSRRLNRLNGKSIELNSYDEVFSYFLLNVVDFCGLASL